MNLHQNNMILMLEIYIINNAHFLTSGQNFQTITNK